MKPTHISGPCCISRLRDWSLITGRGGGNTQREFYPYEKGGAEFLLAMLKGGGDTQNVGIVLAILKAGGGAQNVSTL